MKIYLAKIEGTATPDDFRLTVRILPDMRDILDAGDLPRFPFFFGNRAYTGKLSELVWVLSNDEFTMGYVMGGVSKYDWNDDYAEQSITLDIFEKIRNIYVDLRGIILPFSDLEVTYWDNTCFHAIDRRDGKMIIGFSSGSINIISEDEVLFMVGTEDSKKNSVFRITNDSVSIKAESIYLNGENVYMGRNSYGKVVVTTGGDITTALAAKGVFA